MSSSDDDSDQGTQAEASKGKFWMGSSEDESEEETSEDDSSSDDQSDSDGSSGSGSEEDSDSDSDDEGANAWMKSSSEDSSSDDDDKPLQSKEDKHLSSISDIETQIANAQRINDWIKLQEMFEELNKTMDQISKSVTLISQKEIKRMALMKSMEIGMLITIEDFLEEKLKDGVEPLKENMKKLNYQALTAMRQKMKKHMRDPNRVGEVSVYRVESTPAEERSQVSVAMVCQWLQSHLLENYAGNFQKADIDGVKLLELTEETVAPLKMRAPDAARLLAEISRIQKRLNDEESDEDGDDDKPTLKRKVKSSELELGFEEGVEVTEEMIDERKMFILGQRGKKGTDLRTQVRAFEKLLEYCKTTEKTIEITVQLIAAMFDSMSKLSTNKATEMWRKCHKKIGELLTILNEAGIVLEEDEPQRIMDEFSMAHEMEDEDILADAAMVGPPPPALDEDGNPLDSDDEEEQKLMGNLGNFLDQLDQALFKSLQGMSLAMNDATQSESTTEYIQRLTDEDLLIGLAATVHEYYTRCEKYGPAARVAALRIEHMYYKHDSIVIAKAKAAGVDCPNSKNEIHSLALQIYRDATEERTRHRTILCQIYHHAVHDRYYVGRDMLLMSRLQENIQYEDVSTQILFNRMIVQLGLCAFRMGLIEESHSCLSEIASGSRGDPAWRFKELLAQEVTSRQDRDKERAKLEARRLMPFHMRIDLDLVEAAHMTAAMLLEIPSMAAAGPDSRTQPEISRTFRRYLDHYERNWHGPPETIRETTLAAGKALLKGDWKRSSELLIGLKCWNTFAAKDPTFLEKLNSNLKETALRTYLFTYGAQYDSLSLPQLSAMFEVQENRAHSIVSKMMINEELHASWDQPTKSIVMHKTEPTRLQMLALQYADKCAVLIDANERMMDQRGGGKRNDQNKSGGGGDSKGKGKGGGGGGNYGGRGKGGNFRPQNFGKQGGFMDPSRDWRPRGGGKGGGWR